MDVVPRPCFLSRSQMTTQNSLDVKGTFQSPPFAELLVEIAQTKFDGSLRLAHKDKKTVVCFDKGQLIFGVSNSKALRLFNVMLQLKKIDKQALLQHTNFANDLEFAQSLCSNGGYSETDVAAMITKQVDAIVVDALTWPDGEWHFNPPARLRTDVRYEQKRIHTAFTELAHAYETLKESEARESYNFKMRKEIEAREKRLATGQPDTSAADATSESALDAFEQALSAFAGQLHKAEGEFQTAVRLDPKNPKIRMMLVDFFIDMDQTKRAVGELNRFLEIAPGNTDATRRLQKLTTNN